MTSLQVSYFSVSSEDEDALLSETQKSRKIKIESKLKKAICSKYEDEK